jgi:hypothetical protein
MLDSDLGTASVLNYHPSYTLQEIPIRTPRQHIHTHGQGYGTLTERYGILQLLQHYTTTAYYGNTTVSLPNPPTAHQPAINKDTHNHNHNHHNESTRNTLTERPPITTLPRLACAHVMIGPTLTQQDNEPPLLPLWLSLVRRSSHTLMTRSY